MARKGKEIQLQQEIETQEEWEDMLSKEGLCVIDAYQEWCGPAVGIVATLKKIKNEIGDNLLRFAIAKCDTIDALEKYRGRCEPCFLFFAGGSLVAVVRGANAPLILRTITEQLAQEHKVLDGNAERKEIKDPMLAKFDKQKEEEAEQEEEEEAYHQPVKEVSVVIIKPDAVQSGKADEILEEMRKRNIEILRQEERQLTEEEVKNVYIHLQDEPFFNELVAFMTSAPSIVLAITKGPDGANIINEFRDLIGPTEVEEAKEQAPQSLRAKFGSEKYMNAVHGSDSSDTAARELAFFFPDFAAPPVDGKPKVQRTLALIRPDAYKAHKEEIIEQIRAAGFKIAMQKEIHLTKDQAEHFYKEHQGQEYFDELTTRMSSGPLLALGLAREDAVTGWRKMLGPTKVDEAKEKDPESLRAKFVVDGAQINMLHGSDSEEAAQKEIDFFFPMQQTVAVIKPDAYGTKDEIISKIHDAGFKIAARKETTVSREIAEEFYADHKDKEYYNELVEHMSSGPTMFMVLSREDAVEGWRSMIGPTDPAKAKEVNPDAIRAKFGTDPLKNAVHGSSDPDHAMKQITKIFGELYFDKDGSLRDENKEKKEEEPKSPTPAQNETKEEKKEDQTPTEGIPEQKTEEEQIVDETQATASSPTNQETADVAADKTTTPAADNAHDADNAPADDTIADTEAKEEPQGEAKSDDKPAEAPKTEESKPSESEEKTEEPPKPEEPKAETTEEKKEEAKPEATEEKKEEAKPEATEEKKEEQKPEATEEKKEEQKLEEKKEDEQQKSEAETPAS